MVSAAIRAERLTLEDFVRLFDTEGPFEIINGRRIQKMPTVFPHSEIAHALFKALFLYLMTRPIGQVYLETTFVLPDADVQRWVEGARIPDVMFIKAERLAAYKTRPQAEKPLPLMLVPDLTVEIVPQNDSYSDVAEKVAAYLEDGVQMVWVIDPKLQQIAVYQPNAPTRFLSADDLLEGSELLPDFAIRVGSLFE